MRIAIDCRAFQQLSRYLGIGTYSSNLIQALTQVNGHHELIPFAHVFKGSADGKVSPYERLVDHNGFRVNGERSFLTQLANHRVDLCHVLEFVPPFATTDRTVVTVYDLIPLIFPKVYLPWYKFQTRLNFRNYYRFLKGARQIIVISRHTKADLIRLLGIPSNRIVVIYPGVGSAFRPCPDREKLTLVLTRYRLRSPFFLYVGSCDYRKNIPGLLKAFARFQDRLPGKLSLVLAGRETELKSAWLLKLARKLGITSSLHLAGYVPQEDLVALYNAASMLVFPSFYEGFGFPPLEAMACGTPVITSKISSLTEVTDGCALLVNPYDEEGLAEAMHRMALDGGLRETLIAKGLVRARQFSWERAAQETLRVYEQMGVSLGSPGFPEVGLDLKPNGRRKSLQGEGIRRRQEAPPVPERWLE